MLVSSVVEFLPRSGWMSMLKRKRCMTKPRHGPASMMRLPVARVRYSTFSEPQGGSSGYLVPRFWAAWIALSCLHLCGLITLVIALTGFLVLQVCHSQARESRIALLSGQPVP